MKPDLNWPTIWSQSLRNVFYHTFRNRKNTLCLSGVIITRLVEHVKKQLFIPKVRSMMIPTPVVERHPEWQHLFIKLLPFLPCIKIFSQPRLTFTLQEGTSHHPLFLLMSECHILPLMEPHYHIIGQNGWITSSHLTPQSGKIWDEKELWWGRDHCWPTESPISTIMLHQEWWWTTTSVTTMWSTQPSTTSTLISPTLLHPPRLLLPHQLVLIIS